MSKEIRAHGTSQLGRFCWAVFQSADDGKHGLLPLQAFLPDHTIRSILDNFYSIHEVTDLFPWLDDTYLCENDCLDLFNVCQDLRKEFKEIRHLKKIKAAQVKAQLRTDDSTSESSKSADEAEDNILVVTNESSEQLDICGPSIKWQINFR